MKSTIVYNRFSLKYLLAGIVLSLLDAFLLVYFQAYQALYFPLIVVSIMVLISIYFYNEKLFITEESVTYHTLFKRISINYSEVDYVCLQKKSISDDSQSIIKFFIEFRRGGESVGTIPLGFFKTDQQLDELLQIIKKKNKDLRIDDSLSDFKRKNTRYLSLVITILFVGLLVSVLVL